MASDIMQGMKISLFLVLFTGCLLYMPTQLLTGSDPVEYHIPTEWDPWYLTSNTTSIMHQISQGSRVGYSFSETTAKHYVDITWDTWWGSEEVRLRKHVQVGLFPGWYEPYLTLEKIQGGWDPSINGSIIKLANEQGQVSVLLEDTNGARNNITTAFIANTMNATVIYGTEAFENDLWTSKELVFSILSFKLPQAMQDVNPMIAFVFSAIFYIPIIYIIFGLTIKVLRG